MPEYTATDFYNDELSRLQAKQQNTDTILNSQQRLAMLNDSYRKRYARYVQILMVLILAVLVYLGAVLLQKQFPAIPQVVVDVVTIVLMFLVTFYLFFVGNELYSRSLLNYDELDLHAYDASGFDVSKLADTGQVLSSQSTSGNVCVGSECCPNTYNDETNLCDGFTTLEYGKIESAYVDTKFDSPELKREPNSHNVIPLQDTTVLTYSTF